MVEEPNSSSKDIKRVKARGILKTHLERFSTIKLLVDHCRTHRVRILFLSEQPLSYLFRKRFLRSKELLLCGTTQLARSLTVNLLLAVHILS